MLMKPGAIEAVYLGGRRTALAPPAATRRYSWEHSHRQWSEVYDRDRVARLRAAAR
jgi:hypothetical protein